MGRYRISALTAAGALAALVTCGLGDGCSRTPGAAAGAAAQPHDSAMFSPAAPQGGGGGAAAATTPGPGAGVAAAPDGAAAGAPGGAGAQAPAGGPAGASPASLGSPASPSLAPRPAGFVGVVLARQAVTVSAEADGRLDSVAVRVGDAVRRGQELAALSGEDVRNEMIVVEATLSAARSDQKRAELELDKARDHRARRERHPELYSEEDLASARSSEKEALAGLDSAKARVAEEAGHLRQLATRLQRVVLRAPIDGRVALRYLDAGALVHSGAPVVRLISANEFMLRFAVPAEQAPAIRKGEAVEMRLDSLPLTLAGRVSQVTPRLDTASQMVFVEADLEVPPGLAARLEDGLPGRVTLRG